MKTQSETINASSTPTNVAAEMPPAPDTPAPDTTQLLAVPKPAGPSLPLACSPAGDQLRLPDPSTADSNRRAEIRFRRDSFLASLTSEQLRTLCKWLAHQPIYVVRRWVALPPPKGFGIELHDTTLRRAKATLAAQREIEDFRETCAFSQEYSDALEEDQPNLSGVLSQILLKRALNIARNENAAYDINELVSNVVKLREVELKAERLRLDRQVQTSRPSTPGEPQVHEVNLNIRQPALRPPTAHQNPAVSDKSLANEAAQLPL